MRAWAILLPQLHLKDYRLEVLRPDR
jgi:hypothetical protein